MLLYAVTDRAWTGKQTLYQQVEAALKGGATCVQLREKELDDESFLAEAMEIAPLCRQYSVPFFINDNVNVAIQCHADGIHVGQEDMTASDVRSKVGPDMMIGVSVHSVREALEAVKNGADCLGVGAMFSTSTKSDASVLPWETLRDICQAVDVPVVAIGGIHKSNLLRLAGSGVDGVALVSAIFGAEQIEEECRELRALSQQMVSKHHMKTALTIAGSDCSGGAGIQADLKTMAANGVYGMSAITALTAQNTTGVSGIMEVTPEFLKQQIDMIFTDIRPDAVKIGMVSSSKLIETIAERLRHYQAEHIVVDPVMVSTSGSRLLEADAVDTLKQQLLPLASLVTPNIPEAEILADMTIQNEEDMMAAAKKIGDSYHCSVLVKGGHQINDANDLLYAQGTSKWFYGKRIPNPNTHGTGCTLSSAIASNLAKDYDMSASVERAKSYISGALADMLDLGQGSGPMNHAFAGQWKMTEEKRETTVQTLLAASKDIWDQYYQHPFVMGIQDGTLDREKFRYYIIQDYLYLEDYAKAFAIGIAKAKSLETTRLFSGYIHLLTGNEMDIHRGYMGKFAVTAEELAATPRALDNQSYTSYMLRVAYEESEAEILAAILSCAYSYELIAKNMVKSNPNCVSHPFYGDWVQGYASDQYAEGNAVLFGALNRLTSHYNEQQIKHLTDIFVACSRYELDFWEMAWNMSR